MSRSIGVLAFITLMAASAGCGSPSHPPPAQSDESFGHGPAVFAAPCTDGETASCGVVIASHEGVIDCAVGTKVCVMGSWGTCHAGGSARTVTAPSTMSTDAGGEWSAHTQ
jgi:hypothetical protein